MERKDILLAISVALAWGSYFTVSKIALLSFPPLFLGFLRFFFVFLFTSPFFFKDNIPYDKVFYLSIVMLLNLLLLNYAIHLSSNLSPIILINELAVPLSSLLGVLFLKEIFNFKDALGTIIALIGLAIVIKTRSTQEVGIIAIILAIAAASLFAYYNLIAKQISHYNIFTLLSRMSLVIAPIFLLLSYCQESWPNIKDISLISSASLLYTVIICTLISHASWFFLLNKYSLNKVVPFTLLSPLFGCIISCIILKEHIKINIILGGFLVILGLSIIQLKKIYDPKKL